MPKVSVKIGLTLKLFKGSSYEFIRPEIGIEGIDTDSDVEAQIATAREALNKAWDAVQDEVQVKVVDQMPGVEAEFQMQVGNQLREVKAMLEKHIKAEK